MLSIQYYPFGCQNRQQNRQHSSLRIARSAIPMLSVHAVHFALQSSFQAQYSTTHHPWAQPDGFQRFFKFSTLLMVSTIWGICFSLKANPNGFNTQSFANGFATVRWGETPPHETICDCHTCNACQLGVSHFRGSVQEKEGRSVDARNFAQRAGAATRLAENEDLTDSDCRWGDSQTRNLHFPRAGER